MTEGFPPGAYADWFQRIMTPEKVAAAGAFLLSETCEVSGEAFAIGGSRIARVTLAEAEGVTGLETTEDARAGMPQVMADTRFFYPRDLSERSAKVAGVFGFDGGLDTSGGYALVQDE
jgi:hypothetical protein